MIGSRFAVGWVVGLLALAAACDGRAPREPGEDCPRGTLDQSYCDRDGDLLADPPTEGVNPSVLIFAYTPVEDPAQYREAWQGFLEHLERETGKPVRFYPVQSNAAQIEAMRAGRLHVAGFSTGSVPLAVNAAGFRPFAMMAHRDGRFGYRSVIITLQSGNIDEVEDLRGRKVAFSSPTSNSGFKAPSAILKTHYGIDVERDLDAVFSGKHDNSILGVLHGDYDAAAVADEILHRMVAKGIVDVARLRTVYRSEVFPSTAYGVAHDLDEDLRESIRKAFFSFDWRGSALEQAFSGNAGDSFRQVDYKEQWKVIREIDLAHGVRYVPGSE